MKITAVSYLNTLPFLYGIRQYASERNYTFEQKIPSDCAKQLIENKTDIALIPIAAMPLVKSPYIVSNYCLGAVGKVHTVLLLSDLPLTEIQTVYLDYQSRTSVNLVKVLAYKYWNLMPEWIDASVGFEKNISGNCAGVVIGDRAFALRNKYKYVYDLSEEWYKMTKLPFVFAAWVANTEIDENILDNFNQTLRFGLENMDTAIEEFKNSNPLSEIDLKTYLTKNIDFKLDEKKIESIKLFLNYLVELELLPKDLVADIYYPIL